MQNAIEQLSFTNNNILKNELKEIDLFSPFKLINNENILKIPLKHHSCLGHNYHPNNLLKSDDSFYASKPIHEFANDNYDWIIFEIFLQYEQNRLFSHNLKLHLIHCLYRAILTIHV